MEWVPIVAAFFAPTLAVVISHILTKKRLQEIHLLVNSRLTSALAEISELKARLDQRDRDQEMLGRPRRRMTYETDEPLRRPPAVEPPEGEQHDRFPA